MTKFCILCLIVITLTIILMLNRLSCRTKERSNSASALKSKFLSETTECDVPDENKVDCGFGFNWKKDYCTLSKDCCFKQPDDRASTLPWCFFKKGCTPTEFVDFPSNRHHHHRYTMKSDDKDCGFENPWSSTVKNYKQFGIDSSVLQSYGIPLHAFETKKLKDFFDLYCSDEDRIKVYVTQASLEAFSAVDLSKLPKFIRSRLEHMLKDANLLQGIDMGLTHTGLAFVNAKNCCDGSNDFMQNKVICTVELWGIPGTDLFVSQIAPDIDPIQGTVKGLNTNEIVFTCPMMFGCTNQSFWFSENYESVSDSNYWQYSQFVGETSVENVLKMCNYAKLFNKSLNTYSSINVGDYPAIFCDTFAIEMIKYIKHIDKSFAPNTSHLSFLSLSIHGNVEKIDVKKNADAIAKYSTKVRNILKQKQKRVSSASFRPSFVWLPSILMHIISTMSHLFFSTLYIAYNDTSGTHVAKITNFSIRYSYDNSSFESWKFLGLTTS